MFCTIVLIFGGTEGVDSRFHLLYSRLVFGGTEGVGTRFQILGAQTCFLQYRKCRVQLSSLPRLDSFSAIPWASGLEGDVSRFHVLRAGTSIWRYGGRRV
jgi:hypothetical protein